MQETPALISAEAIVEINCSDLVLWKLSHANGTFTVEILSVCEIETI